MAWLVMCFAVVIAGVLQTLLPAYSFAGQAKAPLLLSVVLYYALSRDAAYMMVAGLLAGCFQDAMSPIPFGYSATCFCVAGWIAGAFRRIVVADAAATRAFFGGAAAAAVTLATYVMVSSAGLAAWPPGRAFLKVAATGFLGLVAAPVVCAAIERLDRAVGNVEVKEDVHEFDLSSR
jgi:rod shape-determining protein MreD